MNILNLTFPQIEQLVLSLNEKKYRSTQIWEFLYRHRVKSFDEMLNIGSNLTSYLKDNYTIDYLKSLSILSDPDGTKKILFGLKDSSSVECVLLENNYGYSLCVSTQVGCNMGCSFCASGQHRKIRDLEAGEIVAQVLSCEDLLHVEIKSVVIMGIGEPFDNYDNSIAFIQIINHAKGLAIGSRHISISTCGIVPKIKEFMKLDTQVNLAISLHASNDETRSKLMRINKAYNIDQLMHAIKEYLEVTKRRITIEYILIDKVNDTPEDALRLISLFKGLNVYINLIPYNEVAKTPFKSSTKEARNKFYDILKKGGVDITIRNPQGATINAACGQLRIDNLL